MAFLLSKITLLFIFIINITIAILNKINTCCFVEVQRDENTTEHVDQHDWFNFTYSRALNNGSEGVFKHVKRQIHLCKSYVVGAH